MFLHSFLGLVPGLPVSGLDLLHRLSAIRQRAAACEHVLDNASDAQETDASAQERRNRHLIGRIQHGRRQPTQSKSLSRQT